MGNVRASSEPNRVEVTSYNGWTHPMWNSNDLSGDLALVELPSPLPMNDYISASCLPAAGETPAVGSMVTVTGWGKPSDSAGGISPVLREVRDIPVISNSDCNDVYGIVGDGVVCIDTTGGRGLATVTLVAPSSRRLMPSPLVTSGPRSELSPSEHLLAVRLACLLDSPGPSTTWMDQVGDRNALKT